MVADIDLLARMSQILSAVTYNARCARALLDILLHSLQRQPTKPPSPDRTLLFALAPSLTTSPEVLSEITSTLTQFYPKHVGCISAPLPYQYVDSGKRNGPHLCSLAYALVDGVPFHSTISGRTQAQVGRWHAARQRRTEDANGAMQVDTEDSQMRISEFCRSDGKVNWENVWDHAVTSSSSHGVGLGSKTLPEALRNLEYVCFFHSPHIPLQMPVPSAHQPDIISFISLTRRRKGLPLCYRVHFHKRTRSVISQHLFRLIYRLTTLSISDVLFDGVQLSLIASSTPFITGRPVTLFYNGSIFSSGAVGIAFNSSPSLPPPVVELSFPPLVALSNNLHVTRYLVTLPLCLGLV